MTINEIYKRFEDQAKCIKGFVVGQKEDVPYDLDVLAEGYIKAIDSKDEVAKSHYISAFMIRYWHMVPYLYEQSKSTGLGREDMVDWIYEAIQKAFEYRSWKDSNKEVSKDARGVEKVINQCITSRRQYWYRYFNNQKRRINYSSTVKSLDAPDVSWDDTPLIDKIKNEDSYNNAYSIVQRFVNKGSIFTALVVDGILFQDSTSSKNVKKIITEVDEEGNVIKTEISSPVYYQSQVKLADHLTTLNETFINYFSEQYDVSIKKVRDVAVSISLMNRRKVYRQIKKALAEVESDKEVMSSLCM